MAVEYNNLRSVMLEYLKTHPHGQFDLISNSISLFFKKSGLELDQNDLEILQQVIHELYI